MAKLFVLFGVLAHRSYVRHRRNTCRRRVVERFPAPTGTLVILFLVADVFLLAIRFLVRRSLRWFQARRRESGP